MIIPKQGNKSDETVSFKTSERMMYGVLNYDGKAQYGNKRPG
jgi:hypothetical protein